MQEFAVFIIISVLVILMIIIYVIERKPQHTGKYVKSKIDNIEYMVRDDLSDGQDASDLLSKLRQNMLLLTQYLNDNKEKYPQYKLYIDRLADKINSVKLYENEENSLYTSYSVNKGEELVFCLRSKADKNKLHDINLLMYVVLHEMAHIANPVYSKDGHDDHFYKIFPFLLNTAIKLNIYHTIDFIKYPTEYCGLTISKLIV